MCTCQFGGGHQVSHCAACHETFTSLTAFDRHQRHGHCTPPASTGLVQHANGRWSLPGRGPAPLEIYAFGADR